MHGAFDSRRYFPDRDVSDGVATLEYGGRMYAVRFVTDGKDLAGTGTLYTEEVDAQPTAGVYNGIGRNSEGRVMETPDTRRSLEAVVEEELSGTSASKAPAAAD